MLELRFIFNFENCWKIFLSISIEYHCTFLYIHLHCTLNSNVIIWTLGSFCLTKMKNFEEKSWSEIPIIFFSKISSFTPRFISNTFTLDETFWGKTFDEKYHFFFFFHSLFYSFSFFILSTLDFFLSTKMRRSFYKLLRSESSFYSFTFWLF